MVKKESGMYQRQKSEVVLARHPALEIYVLIIFLLLLFDFHH